jgi:hypothetical protein
MEYICPRCEYKTTSKKRIDVHFNRKKPCKILCGELTHNSCDKIKSDDSILAPEIKKQRVTSKKKVIEPEIVNLVDQIRDMLIMTPKIKKGFTLKYDNWAKMKGYLSFSEQITINFGKVN